MSDSPERPPGPPGAESRPLSRWVVLMPALTLVVGLVLGGVVVGVAQDDGDTTSDRVGSESASPTASASNEPGTAVIAPDSCLEAAETVRQATELIRGGIESIREFRAEEIIDLLNELETLDNRAREQASTCSGTTVTDAPLDPAATATREPTSEPSATE